MSKYSIAMVLNKFDQNRRAEKHLKFGRKKCREKKKEVKEEKRIFVQGPF